MFKAFQFSALLAFSVVLTPVFSVSVRAEEEAELSFAIIGDLPYGVKKGEHDADFENLVHQLNTDSSLAWVVHVGDIKSGRSSCSNDFLSDRKTRLGKINIPLVYTPGDNEWTDCHTIFTGSHNSLERLSKLRELFFLDDRAEADRNILGVTQQSQAQSEHKTFIENYSWFRHGVQFISLHMVGSANGKAKYSALSAIRRTEKHDQEVTAREQAALDWLDYGFAQAKKNNAEAVFLITHANTGLARWPDKKIKAPFQFFNMALAKHVEKFPAPVVLAHGDSHYARIDSPKIDGRKHSKKFLRLESFGENNNAWIKVTINPSTPNIFSFTFYDGITPLKND